jgi:hypothetical protein
MHADPEAAAAEIRLREVEGIAVAYHRAAQGDGWAALRAAIADALVDLDALEQRLVLQGRLISPGYARGWTGTQTERGDLRAGRRTAAGSMEAARPDEGTAPGQVCPPRVTEA